jgi:hypothetical protein
MKKLHGPFIYSLMLSLLVSACGGGGGSDGVESTNTAGTPVAEESLPDIDFTPAVLSVLTGTYAGTACTKLPAVSNNAKDTNETLSISPEGDVKLADIQFTMTDAEASFRLNRSFDTTGKISIEHFVTSKSVSPGFTFGLTDGDTKFIASIGNQDTATGMAIGCDGIDDISTLKEKSLYSAVSKHMDAPEVTMSCWPIDNPLIRIEMKMKISNGVVLLNGETFPLQSGLKSESLVKAPHYSKNTGGLIYRALHADGRYLDIYYTSKGVRHLVDFKSSTGLEYRCGKA